MRRCCVLLSLVVLTLGFAPAPLPRAKRSPTIDPALIGTWKGESLLEITATRLIYNPGPKSCEYRLTIHDAGRLHAYNLLGVEGNVAAGYRYSGIYRVEKDRLILSYDVDGSRPTAFDGPGAGRYVEVYVRVRR